ncbi:MAG: efflux RND transporter periplasmic adaptor subunit [Betaproteobacteria bacterium]|nr:efflux RND transporter periplasmic adaptor subunit [Betaproteobacteria bacterium]
MKSIPALMLLAAWVAAPLVTLAQVPATAPVEMREVELTYPAEAIVEAVKQTTIAARMQGRILETRADAGSRVRAGEVLMRLDARDAAQGLAGAQAQLVNARAAYERSKDLFAQKFVSQAALDKAQADYQAASASAGQAGIATSFATIIAPFAGVVAQRLAETGDMAEPGKPLFSVFDPKTLRVVASIPQYQLAGIKQAMSAKIEFPETGKWVAATRTEVLPTADASTHVVRVRVTLPDNLEGAIPGMFVRAHFAIGKASKLLVPAAAVLRRGEVTGVYVVDAQGQAHLRQVRLGEAYGGAREVLAGLSAGEMVALDPVQAGVMLKQIQSP